MSGIVAENTHDKYRKNSKCNKIPDLEKKEAKKDPEMSANIAKLNKDVSCELKTPVTKIAKITNLTRIKT